jgi:hypothetical protein
MTVRELLENAHLDALGLLDDDERAAFERAFRSAPASVRAQIRDEQSRWARMESCLPRTEPGEDLRERVLAAIRSEIDLESASEALVGLTPAELGDDAPISGEVESIRRRKVPAFWQGAAVAMFCVALVLGGAFAVLLRDYTNITQQSRQTAWMERGVSVFRNGDTLRDVLLDPSSQLSQMTSSIAGCSGSVWTNPNWEGFAFVVTDGLRAPEGTSFRVIAISEDGTTTTTLAEKIEANGSLQRFELNLNGVAPGTKLAIVPVVNGQVGTPVLTCTVRLG